MSLWPYRFLSLSPEETETRRLALSQKGHYAQLSAIAVIIFLSVFRFFSPQSSKTRTWWDKPCFQGWGETRRQYFLVGLWLLWLISLSAWGTGQDYLHFTKAVAHVALSQLPFQILLSPVSFLLTGNTATASLLTVLTSLSPPSLAPYHRLIGRLVMVPLLILHGALYLNFFIQSSHPTFGVLLYKRILDTDVQLGISAVTIAGSVLLFTRSFLWKYRTTTSLGLDTAQGRRQVFNIIHLTLVAVLVILAYFHVIYARVFVLEAVGLAVINVLCVKWGPRREIDS